MIPIKEFAQTTIRGYFSADLVISLIGLVEFTALIWYFNLVGNFSDNLKLNLVYFIIPLLFYKTPPREGPWYRTLNIGNAFIVIFLFFALLIMVGESSNLPWLGFNAGMIFAALPFLFILVYIFRRRPFLGLGIVPAAILAVGSLVLAIPPESRIGYLLFPVPVVLPLCIVWALIAWKFLDLARAYQYRAVWGSLYEFSMMAVLFMPFVALVLVATRIMSGNPIWIAVSATILGAFFSSVVAAPLRKFLLEFAKLKSNSE